MENSRTGYSIIKPTMFLIRGIPGSGKSTFANHIWNEYAICEADKYFIDRKLENINLMPLS